MGTRTHGLRPHGRNSRARGKQAHLGSAANSPRKNCDNGEWLVDGWSVVSECLVHGVYHGCLMVG